MEAYFSASIGIFHNFLKPMAWLTASPFLVPWICNPSFLVKNIHPFWRYYKVHPHSSYLHKAWFVLQFEFSQRVRKCSMRSALVRSHLCSLLLSRHGWLWPSIQRHRVKWLVGCWWGRRCNIWQLLLVCLRIDFFEVQETKFCFHFVYESWISCVFGCMVWTLMVKTNT